MSIKTTDGNRFAKSPSKNQTELSSLNHQENDWTSSFYLLIQGSYSLKIVKFKT